MALCLVDIFSGGGDLGILPGFDFWRSGETTRIHVRPYPWRVPLAFDACVAKDRRYHWCDARQPVVVAAFPHPGSRAPAALVVDRTLLVRHRDPAGAEPGKQQLIHLLPTLVRHKKSRPTGAGRQKSLSGSSTFGLSRELDRFSRDVVDRFSRDVVDRFFKGCGSTLAFQGLSVAVQRIWI